MICGMKLEPKCNREDAKSAKENAKKFILATDGAPIDTDEKTNSIDLSVFIGAPSVANSLRVFAVAFIIPETPRASRRNREHRVA